MSVVIQWVCSSHAQRFRETCQSTIGTGNSAHEGRVDENETVGAILTRQLGQNCRLDECSMYTRFLVLEDDN